MVICGKELEGLISKGILNMTIEEYRLRYGYCLGSSSSRTAGLMPSLSEGAMPDLHEECLMPSLSEEPSVKSTYLAVNPKFNGQIGRASFDFRFGKLVAWCDSVLSNVTSEDLEKMEHKILEEGESFDFSAQEDRIYYVTSFENIEHSGNLEISVHSKSTTGRVGCQCRGVGRTYGRELITLIHPLQFNLRGTCGKTQFAQGVVRYKDTAFPTRQEIIDQGLVDLDGLELEEALTYSGLEMRFDTSKAYRARRTDEPIDMDARNLNWRNWWELIEGNDHLVLDKRTLYLLGSLGQIKLNGACGILSKEQHIFNGLGGFACLAGVIQDKFSGRITMEPYFQTKTIIKTGDLAGTVIIDRIDGEKSKEKYEGTYKGSEAPKLPKMFSEE